LAGVYSRRRQPDQAAQQLAECLKINQENREVRLNLLDLLANANSWSQFEQVVNAAELNPKLNSDPVWFRVHAKALAKQVKFDNAIEKIQLEM
jgi:hypothetical protein